MEAPSNIRIWMQGQLFFYHSEAKEMCLLSWLSRKKIQELSNVFYKYHKTVQGHFRSANGTGSNFLCTMYRRRREKACTRSIGLITSYLTKLILAEIEEFHRIKMRTRTTWGNSDIKQLCAFLIRFFYQPCFAIGVIWLCLVPSISI